MFVDDIVSELKLGETYTVHQVLGHMLQYDTIVLCDIVHFSENNQTKLKVTHVFESFLHRSEPRWTYQVPNQKKKIVKLERA